MHGEKREHEILVEQQAVRPVFDGFHDLRAETEESLQSGEAVHPHTEVNDNEIGVAGEIDGAAFDASRHGASLLTGQDEPGGSPDSMIPAGNRR
jgi:hypothetical protein